MKIVYFTKTALSGMIDAFIGILRVVAAFAHARMNTGTDVACRVSTTMTTGSLLRRLRVGIQVSSFKFQVSSFILPLKTKL